MPGRAAVRVLRRADPGRASKVGPVLLAWLPAVRGASPGTGRGLASGIARGIVSGMASNTKGVAVLMATDQDEKVRENRLRRMAERQGLKLVKSRRRDPRAIDYGGWMIVDADTNTAVAGTAGTGRPNYSLDDVEAYLTGGDA